jgi:hypothetical protein
MEVRLLGPVELAVDEDRLDVGGPRAQAVLALLAVRAGEVVTADWRHGCGAGRCCACRTTGCPSEGAVPRAALSRHPPRPLRE